MTHSEGLGATDTCGRGYMCVWWHGWQGVITESKQKEWKKLQEDGDKCRRELEQAKADVSGACPRVLFSPCA